MLEWGKVLFNLWKVIAQLKKFFSLTILPFLVAGFFFFQVDTADAAMGGRMGGRAFRVPSPSYPTRRYAGGVRRGGGFGFPFIIPIFGFGGGGLLTLFVLFAVVSVFSNSFSNRD